MNGTMNVRGSGGAAAAVCLLGVACAGVPTVSDERPDAARVILAIHHDRVARPALLRLARAEYAIDGRAVVTLVAADTAGGDVADEASWTGALRPGEHVLEARLRYPLRSAPSDDLEFQVVKQYR